LAVRFRRLDRTATVGPQPEVATCAAKLTVNGALDPKRMLKFIQSSGLWTIAIFRRKPWIKKSGVDCWALDMSQGSQADRAYPAT